MKKRNFALHIKLRSCNIKNIQLTLENFELNFLYSDERNTPIGGKWLPYFLVVTAIILWIFFNIVAIESYQFPPYLLLFMNIIMYFIMAAMASPGYSEESKPYQRDKPKSN